MADSFTPNKGLILQQTGNNVGTWGSILNTDAISILDNNLGGNLTKSVAGNTDVTLSSSEAENLFYSFTGALTGNINVIWPTGSGLYVVQNSTTGAYTLTVKPLGGTGVVIPSGGIAEVFVSTNTGTAVITNNVFASTTSPTFTGTVNVTGTLATTGNVGVGAAASVTYALNVVQANGSQAYFGSTGANSSAVTVDNAAGGQYATVNFQDAGVTKWGIGKNTSNQFVIADDVASVSVFTATTSGNTVLGQAQNFTIDASGNATTLTQSAGNNTTRIATTAFVNTALGSTLTLANGTTATTQSAGDNSTKVATTAYAGGTLSSSATGYTKLPNGLILQWAPTGTINGGSHVDVSLPLTFPNNVWQAFATINFSSDTSNVYGIGTQIINTSTIRVHNLSGSPYSACIFVIGN